MIGPIRFLRDTFNVQLAAERGWAYQHPAPTLSPERKQALMEASALETPRGIVRTWLGILVPYWSKSGPAEIASATSLAIGAFLSMKFMVDMQVDFSFFSREIGDLTQQVFTNMMAIRPPLLDELLPNYPALQQLVENDVVLQKMIHTFPDTTSFVTVPEIAEFFNQDRAHAQDWANFLRNSPSFDEIMQKYPASAQAITENPAILDELHHLDGELGKRLMSDDTWARIRNTTGNLFFSDFVSNWGRAFGSVVNDILGSSNRQAFNDASGAYVEQARSLGLFSEDTKEAFSTAWNSKDFMNVVLKFMAMAVTSYKCTQTLALRWRGWMTPYYINKWMDCKAYHRLKNEFNIDNPDQRIQDDPYRFTAASVSMSTTLVRAGMTFYAYAGILWGLANMNLAYFGGPDYVVPGTMFWFGLSYATALTALNFAAGYKLPQIGRNQQMREANFRSALKKVQDNDDQIAHNNLEDMEKEAIRKSYVPVLNNQVREINTDIKVNVVDMTFGNLSIPAPMVAGMFAIASGSASMGTLTLLNSAFGQVTSVMTIIASRFKMLTDMQAIASRLTMFDIGVEAARYLEEEKRQEALKLSDTSRRRGPQPA